jgi:hypothetical protein
VKDVDVWEDLDPRGKAYTISQVYTFTRTSADFAEAADRWGQAHGQAPPEATQGIQRSQSSQVLSCTRTSAEVFGNMADEITEWADLVDSMADKTS